MWAQLIRFAAAVLAVGAAGAAPAAEAGVATAAAAQSPKTAIKTSGASSGKQYSVFDMNNPKGPRVLDVHHRGTTQITWGIILCVAQFLVYLLPLLSLLGFKFALGITEFNAKRLSRDQGSDEEDEENRPLVADAKDQKNDMPPDGVTSMLLASASWTFYFTIHMWTDWAQLGGMWVYPLSVSVLGLVLAIFYVVYYGKKVMVAQLYKTQYQCQLASSIFLLCIYLFFLGFRMTLTLGVCMTIVMVLQQLSPLLIVFRAAKTCKNIPCYPTLLYNVLALTQSCIWCFVAGFGWVDPVAFSFFLIQGVLQCIVLCIVQAGALCSKQALKGGYSKKDFKQVFSPRDASRASAGVRESAAIEEPASTHIG
ncbi:unnamed protein product [Amoebophrya sp. A25]|nr:unnamed protein product [Amoebophrya sp. A25]|eukprot:GSA25T00011553001.1